MAVATTDTAAQVQFRPEMAERESRSQHILSHTFLALLHSRFGEIPHVVYPSEQRSDYIQTTENLISYSDNPIRFQIKETLLELGWDRAWSFLNSSTPQELIHQKGVRIDPQQGVFFPAEGDVRQRLKADRVDTLAILSHAPQLKMYETGMGIFIKSTLSTLLSHPEPLVPFMADKVSNCTEEGFISFIVATSALFEFPLDKRLTDEFSPKESARILAIADIVEAVFNLPLAENMDLSQPIYPGYENIDQLNDLVSNIAVNILQKRGILKQDPESQYDILYQALSVVTAISSSILDMSNVVVNYAMNHPNSADSESTISGIEHLQQLSYQVFFPLLSYLPGCQGLHYILSKSYGNSLYSQFMKDTKVAITNTIPIFTAKREEEPLSTLPDTLEDIFSEVQEVFKLIDIDVIPIRKRVKTLVETLAKVYGLHVLSGNTGSETNPRPLPSYINVAYQLREYLNILYPLFSSIDLPINIFQFGYLPSHSRIDNTYSLIIELLKRPINPAFQLAWDARQFEYGEHRMFNRLQALHEWSKTHTLDLLGVMFSENSIHNGLFEGEKDEVIKRIDSLLRNFYIASEGRFIPIYANIEYATRKEEFGSPRFLNLKVFDTKTGMIFELRIWQDKHQAIEAVQHRLYKTDARDKLSHPFIKLAVLLRLGIEPHAASSLINTLSMEGFEQIISDVEKLRIQYSFNPQSLGSFVSRIIELGLNEQEIINTLNELVTGTENKPTVVNQEANDNRKTTSKTKTIRGAKEILSENSKELVKLKQLEQSVAGFRSKLKQMRELSHTLRVIKERYNNDGGAISILKDTIEFLPHFQDITSQIFGTVSSIKIMREALNQVGRIGIDDKSVLKSRIDSEIAKLPDLLQFEIEQLPLTMDLTVEELIAASSDLETNRKRLKQKIDSELNAILSAHLRRLADH